MWAACISPEMEKMKMVKCSDPDKAFCIQFENKCASLVIFFSLIASARTTDLSWTSDSDDATHSASSLLNVDESNYQEWTFLDDFHSEALWDVNSLRLHQARLSSTNSHQSYHGNGNGSCDMDEDLFDPGHCDVGQHQEGHGVTDPGDLKRAVKDRCGTFSHKSFPVFLRTKHCQHTPAVLHLVSIFPGVILVLVSEVFYCPVCCLLSILPLPHV